MTGLGGNAILNSAIAQGGTAYGLASMRKSRDCVNMTAVKAMNDVVDLATKRTLEEDLRRLERMTLIDERDILDSMHLMSSAFDRPAYLYSALRSLYEEKYEELIERYRSVRSWLNYCLAVLVFQDSGVAFLERQNVRSGPVVMSKISLARMVRRRKMDACDESSSSPAAKRANLETKLRVGHPFFKCRAWSRVPQAFEVGKMLKFCFPTEFGLLTMNAVPGSVVKYKTGFDDREKMDGIRGQFSKPLIGSLQSREVKSNSFYHILDIQLVGDVVASMCGLELENDVMSMGRRKDMRTFDLSRGDVDFPRERLNSPGYEFVVLNAFSAYATAGGLVQIKTYVNNIYRLDGEMADLPESTIASCQRVVDDNRDDRERELDQYDADVEAESAGNVDV